MQNVVPPDTRALRIGPNELHISDVQQYGRIYNQTTNFYKQHSFYDGFITPHTVFAETDPDLHKVRRKMLNSLFSRAGVFKLEPVIHQKLSIVDRKIRRLWKKQDIDLYKAIRGMTTEIISEFAFARSAGFIQESENSFDCDVLDAFDLAGSGIADLQHSAFLRTISMWTPAAITKKLSRELGLLLEIHDVCTFSAFRM